MSEVDSQPRPLSEENVVASVANDHGDSQSAYPLSIVSGSMGEIYGLTKRELFAAMAMQGMLSDHTITAPWDAYATMAVGAADALLKELAK